MEIKTISRKKIVDYLLDEYNKNGQLTEEQRELLIEMGKSLSS